MPPSKQLVYVVVLLRIYECGGACPDSLNAICNRTNLNKRIVSDALDELFREGRLNRGEGGIHNSKADRVIADSKSLFQKRKTAGAEAANRRWEKRKQKQQNGDSEPNAIAMRSDAHLHLQEQDSLFPNGNRGARARELDAELSMEAPPQAPSKPKRTAARSRMPDNFELSPEMYDEAGQSGFGDEKIGEMFRCFCDHHRAKGNLMADWRAAWRTWIRNEVRFNRERNGGRDGANRAGSGKGGYATIAARIRRGAEQSRSHDSAAFGGFACDFEQANRHRDSPQLLEHLEGNRQDAMPSTRPR